jgi:hypothetical protein
MPKQREFYKRTCLTILNPDSAPERVVRARTSKFFERARKILKERANPCSTNSKKP